MWDACNCITSVGFSNRFSFMSDHSTAGEVCRLFIKRFTELVEAGELLPFF